MEIPTEDPVLVWMPVKPWQKPALPVEVPKVVEGQSAVAVKTAAPLALAEVRDVLAKSGRCSRQSPARHQQVPRQERWVVNLTMPHQRVP